MFDIDEKLLQRYCDSIDLTNFPKKFLLSFEKWDPDTKTKWYAERFKCLKYPLYLAGFVPAEKAGDPDLPIHYVPILGMDFQHEPHSELFRQLLPKRPGEDIVLYDLDPVTKKRMVLWPRGVFKTSAVVVDIVQTILNYPNVRICFLTGSDDLAKRQLARVKKVFEKPTARFKFLFPEFCATTSKQVRSKGVDPETGKVMMILEWEDLPTRMGTAHDFTVPCRTNDTFAEPTFAISTAKAVKSGAHFDLIYIDDLVNDQNYRSEKALEKCYNNYIDICPVLDPKGYIIMTGTRYSFGDTYQRIQEKAHEEEQELGHSIWKFSIRDCWSKKCKNCGHSDVFHDYSVNISQPPCTLPECRCPGCDVHDSPKGVLFPEKRTFDGRPIGHTLEFLEGEKLRYGPEFFAMQYENQPIAKESQVFTDALIGRQTLHDMRDIPSYAQSSTIVVGDLAYIGQEGHDYSVLFVCRVFQGRIYIFDCLFGNWDSGQVAENTVNVLLKHRPVVLFYEKFNGWEAYNNIITTYAAAKHIQKVPLQWEKVAQGADAKLTRIGAIKGVLEGKRLWFYSGMPGYQQLSQQLVKWPKLGRHDDFADCAGMVVTVPSGYQLENPPVPESSKNWLRRFNQSAIVEEPDSRPAGSY